MPERTGRIVFAGVVAGMLAIAAALDAPPASAATPELPWCAYDDPATYRVMSKAGGPACPERRPGVELPETLYLPLPCDHWMAFRRVSVPASDPLASEHRVFGYSMRTEGELEAYRQALFGPWEALVAGSFSEDEDHRPLRGNYRQLAYRSYYIGRYEVTELQYALFTDGLFDHPEASDAGHDICREALQRRLTSRGRVRPAVGIDVFSAFRFVEAVNRWIMEIDRDRIRRGQLPWMPWEQGSPGFLRLPSEAEWELAAWGGPDFAPKTSATRRFHLVPADGTFEEPDSARRIAVIFEEGRTMGVHPIGTRRPNPLGLYDVLGNAEELVWDLFSAVRPDRRLGGHSGGMVARGGSYRVSEDEISIGYRSEIPIFTAEGPGRAPALGLRLAVAAPFWTNDGDWRKSGSLNHALLAAVAAARTKALETASTSTEETARLHELQQQLETIRRQAQAHELDRARLEQQLGTLASETQQLKLRLAQAERERIQERVRSGVMLTKAIREFGGVALSILLQLEDVARRIRGLPSPEQHRYLPKVKDLCEKLAVRERQMENQYDTLLGWTDELARAPRDTVDDAFTAIEREFRSRRLAIYDDELALFRRMVHEALHAGGVTAQMRRGYLGEIDIARARRQGADICTKDL